MKYEYDINGEVLSLVLKVEDHSLAQQATITSFKSYNINIKTKELLENEKVLDLFNTTEENIEKIIKKETKDYYNNLVSNNNISINECNYNCYIKNNVCEIPHAKVRFSFFTHKKIRHGFCGFHGF